jgi:TonB family protein
MRSRGTVLAVFCTGVAVASAHVARAQEATSANLPDQFQTGEMTQLNKPKKKQLESSSQIATTAPQQNSAPVSEQPAAEELPGVAAAQEKHAEPAPAVQAKTNITSARIAKSAPSEQQSKPEVAPIEKKTRPKMLPRPVVQTKATAVPEPVPMSLSVAQSMAISAPLPEYTYEAKRRNLAGSGICLVTVDPVTGRVTDARMFQSTGSNMLDKLTIQTFKSWRFKPGTVSQVRVPISYE